jgi:cell division protein FtsI (penicillin-binding protein 3)
MRDDQNHFPVRGRFVFFASLFFVLAMAVLCRYAYLMLGNFDRSRDTPPARYAGRGPILDRNGHILAMETRMGNVTLWKPEMRDPEELSRELAPILEMSQGEILERIRSTPSDFMYLKRQANESTLRILEAARTEGRLRGINIEPVVGRIYPEGNLASQIIGFVGDDNNGLEGIEYTYDAELTAKTENNPTGNPGGPEGGGKNQNGNQIFLTIDTNIQHILEKIASDILTANKAESVMFMAMDPRTGEILGSASLPNFDPNNFKNSDEYNRRDRPALSSYEPGSVFKVFSLAALIDIQAISNNSTFICDGHYERVTNLGERITINCLGAHGEVGPREIIIYSCNAGAAYASDRLGAAPFHALLRDFGFGGRTGAGIPGETSGLLRPVERWSERSKPSIAMGQEIGVSALQVIQAASAIANDGIMVTPRIVSRIVSADGKNVKNFEALQPRRVLKAETARSIRRYMMDVTSNIGTGWRANVEDLSLAVKTGTAQIIDQNTKTYSSTDFIASCIALLPAESPSLVLYLVIIKPQGISYLGGRVAAPPIREAAESLINYLGIPRGRNPQITHSGSLTIPSLGEPSLTDTVPDFTGLSKRELLPLLLREDLRINLFGEGWVRRQTPPPGTAFTPDMVITLELE